jgi:hypothetical protein
MLVSLHLDHMHLELLVLLVVRQWAFLELKFLGLLVLP